MAQNPSPTELFLPSSFPYPIKIVSVDAAPASTVQRGTRLLSYSFVHVPAQRSAEPESRFGTWDSAIEGKIKSWKVKPGDVISQQKAKERPVVVVLEDCKHGMQVGGLCVMCGKDMTTSDYIGFADSSRANIQMTHSADGPTVSLEEAQRLEREMADDLLKARKLSLIVDLDQTIVHATVDPTVGEWKADGAAWKVRQTDENDPQDVCNPNWEALEDVAEFRLTPEAGMFGKGKNKMLEHEGPVYYIKRRPGWHQFLEDMSTKYQMHVYTMGTRAYAEQVCALIDPEGKFFGGRLLSRDESGSLTQKSLQRLFPCDTSMVVIIDDRADVWEWSPNLIKVVPFDFFVGIGDINSAFLPKIEPLTPAGALSKKPPTPASPSDASTPPSGDPAQVDPSSPSPVSDVEAARAEQEEKAMLKQNTIALEAQVEERPLAKKQEELQVAASTSKDAKGDNGSSTTTLSPEKGHDHDPVSASSPPPKALLKNDDNEMQRLGQLLDEVHRRFFAVYDEPHPEERAPAPSSSSSRRRQNSIRHKPPYDVTLIIPRIRSEVFAGVHILFSSVIPLDTNPETAEVWRLARMFGATCSTELSGEVTHVVAAKRGTVKVDAARKRGGIKIVWFAWFTDCVALWQRQDETPYLLDDAPVVGVAATSANAGAAGAVDPLKVSAEGVAENVDWDEPPTDGANGALALDSINWDDINNEVDAAMNESDDDEELEAGEDARSARSERSAMSEDEWTDDASVHTASAPTTPNRGKRKRLRSVTPSSDAALNGIRDALSSPLAKRKKVAAERTGASKLKVAITADELRTVKALGGDGDSNGSQAASPVSRTSEQGGDDGEDDDGDDDDDGEDEDDFLARELEEEWG